MAAIYDDQQEKEELDAINRLAGNRASGKANPVRRSDDLPSSILSSSQGNKDQDDEYDDESKSDETNQNKDQDAAGQSQPLDTVGKGYSSEDFKERLAKRFGNGKNPAKKAGKLKKWGFIGGIFAAFSTVIIAAIVLITLVGPYKEVHFATVLRSVGMARYMYDMKRQFASTTFNAATLTDSSTGNIKLGSTSLIQKLRGINPEKQLTILGKEGTLKFDFTTSCKWGCAKTTSNLRGVVIDGKEITLDSFAPEGKTYNDLSIREKMNVKNQFSNAIKDGLADRLSIEGRAFRSSIFNGLRQVTGISMTKWAMKARDYIGKSPAEAKAKNITDTAERVSGDGRATSSVGAIEDGADAATDPANADKAAKAKLAREKAVRMSETAGKASLVVLAATTGCIIHDLNNSFVAIQTDREQQMARLGHDALTTADQTKVGDTVGEAVGADNSRWDGAENSVLYKQSVGETVTDADLAQINEIPASSQDSGFAKTIGVLEATIDTATSGGMNLLIPGFSAIQNDAQDIGCQVVLNPNVQWAIAGGDLVISAIATFYSAGGAGAARVGAQAALEGTVRNLLYMGASMGVGEFIGSLIDKAVDNFTSFSGAETGTSLYNDTAVSVNYLEQTGTRQITYGAPESPQEAAQSDQIALQDLKSSYNDSSFNERYFALSNPFSLTSRAIPLLPTSLSDMGSFLPKLFNSIFSSPLRFFGSLFGSGKVAAATPPFDYSPYSAQWGWTTAEMDKVDNDPSFLPQALTDYYADHMDDKDSNGQTFYSRYEQCYSAILQKDIPGYCTGDYLGTDLALHWRYYQSMYLASDWLSSDDLGVRDASVNQTATPPVAGGGDILGVDKATLQSPSDSINCAEGTNDVGVHDGYVAGKVVKIRLCAIPGLPSTDAESTVGNTYYIEGANGLALVNSRASSTILKMVNDMKAAGLDLSVTSSWRSNERQTYLYNTLGSGTAAKPGTSNHQMGFALDWRIYPGHQSPDAGCKRVNGNCSPGQDPYGIYAWLTANASKYGYAQYSEEFWHWEAAVL